MAAIDPAEILRKKIEQIDVRFREIADWAKELEREKFALQVALEALKQWQATHAKKNG